MMADGSVDNRTCTKELVEGWQRSYERKSWREESFGDGKQVGRGNTEEEFKAAAKWRKTGKMTGHVGEAMETWRMCMSFKFAGRRKKQLNETGIARPSVPEPNPRPNWAAAL
jgi:hypothetical protein